MFRKTLLIVALVSLVMISGCATQGPGQDTTYVPWGGSEQPANLESKGVTLTPRSFGLEDFTGFFEKVKVAGKIVTWSGDWAELTTDGAPYVLAEVSKTYGLTPLVILQFFDQDTGELLRPLDDENKASYMRNAVDFAEKYKPKYLGIGIEVNVYYENVPNQLMFDRFVAFFNEVYNSVKAVSPDTKIFTVFQLERMKGLKGGLFGGGNEPTNPDWGIIEKFKKNDMIVFTTYPGLIYRNPSEIPDTYYQEIPDYGKPVAFTEVGWHSAAGPEGWESNETEQAEFISRFFSMTKDAAPEFSVWAFVYDQNTTVPFNSMGLFAADGSGKQAWDAWVAG